MVILFIWGLFELLFFQATFAKHMWYGIYTRISTLKTWFYNEKKNQKY